MTFRQETDSKKIREFLDMVENHKVEMRRYRYPALVWAIKEGTVYYSFWEKDMLEKFGLVNVDGWDYEEDVLFCPDWIDEKGDDDDLEDDPDDDEDLDLSFFKETDKS